MPNRLVGANAPALKPQPIARAISMGSIPQRFATGIPTGAITRDPSGEPIAEMAAVRAKNRKGMMTALFPTRTRAASSRRSMVPLAWAMPKKYVTPTSSTMMLTGKPSTTLASGIRASAMPTPHAAPNMMMPRGALRRWAIAKIAMKIPMAASCRSIQ